MYVRVCVNVRIWEKEGRGREEESEFVCVEFYKVRIWGCKRPYHPRRLNVEFLIVQGEQVVYFVIQTIQFDEVITYLFYSRVIQ